MNENSFNGPLFIVGLSRSGTKLIRDLLNRNSKIAIPEIETHFIPAYLAENKQGLEELYDSIEKSSFVKRFPNKAYPSLKELGEIKSLVDNTDLIESVLKYYAIEENEEWDNELIWGDKTPSYLRHLDFLKAKFPSCKFIHIIRDPRDRALSVNKTWNKSMYRATELWRREIENSSKWRNNKNDYFEFKYEQLLEDSEGVLKKVCSFLGIDFSQQMLELSKPSEKYGSNSNRTGVGTQNTSKYLNENPQVIKRIEEIGFPVMKKMGYKIEYAKKYKPFPDYKMFYFKVIDYLNFKVSVVKKGY